MGKKYTPSPETLLRNRERFSDRYKNDPEFRERIKANGRRRRLAFRDSAAFQEAERRAALRYRRSPKGIFARRRKDLRAYGLTVEQYDAMLAKQNGVCALCGKPESRRRGERVEFLTVDHCHESGRIRGLLCRTCNRGLGLLGDTVTSLQQAVRYLTG